MECLGCWHFSGCDLENYLFRGPGSKYIFVWSLGWKKFLTLGLQTSFSSEYTKPNNKQQKKKQQDPSDCGEASYGFRIQEVSNRHTRWSFRYVYHSLWWWKGTRWVVDQLPDLFRTTHRVKTRQVVRTRGQDSADIELPGYLQNAVGTVSLVMDLRIDHERWGSRTDPTLNGHLHYPNDF
jgi:hypothetical protein